MWTSAGSGSVHAVHDHGPDHPSSARVEISKPGGHEPGAWLAILAAIADRFGSYRTTDGEETLWIEVELRGPSARGPARLQVGDNARQGRMHASSRLTRLSISFVPACALYF